MTRFARRLLTATAVTCALGASSIFGAQYTIQMQSVASPGGYRFAPDDAAFAAHLASLYSSEATFGSYFWSMCIETNEYFQSGKRYDASITGPTAFSGGSGGAVAGADPISVGSAFLFKALVLGQLDDLTGISYAGGLGAMVQRTIWALEGETGYSIEAALLPYLPSNHLDTYTGDEVQVMNLTKYTGLLGGSDSLSGTSRQDQLVLYRVPDGGLTALLLGSALLALGLARRRFAA